MSPIFGKHSAPDMPHQMVRDEEGHWYVIPTNEHRRFHKFLEDARNGETSDEDEAYFDACMFPGPHMLLFTQWEVK
jgi:hypothetical protein